MAPAGGKFILVLFKAANKITQDRKAVTESGRPNTIFKINLVKQPVKAENVIKPII